MPDTKKNGARSYTQGWTGLFKVAIVGASSLKGKEVKEVLDERKFPAIDVKLLDDDEALGQLEAVGDEATFIQPVTSESFEGIDIAFFASDSDFARRNWKYAQKAGASIVDLSYGLETEAGLRPRSLWIEKELDPASDSPLDLKNTSVVTAHPAAIMLGLMMLRAQSLGKTRAVAATLFEPVSEQGKRGMDELHQQTLNLLSFQQMPKEMYDVQIAFNLLSRFGQQAKASLDRVGSILESHFEHITRGKAELPALQILQAPTFHAHLLSIYLEFDRKVAMEEVAGAIRGEHVQIVNLEDDGPSNVTAAGQDDLLVSLRADARRPHGVWLWAAADNLRISAINAVECAQMLAAARPAGKIQ